MFSVQWNQLSLETVESNGLKLVCICVIHVPAQVCLLVLQNICRPFYRYTDALLDSTIIIPPALQQVWSPFPSRSLVGGDDGTTLRVQVMSYPPPDHVQWYMNGSLVMSSDLYLISNISVSDNSTVSITYSASLTISSVNLTTQWPPFMVMWVWSTHPPSLSHLQVVKLAGIT